MTKIERFARARFALRGSSMRLFCVFRGLNIVAVGTLGPFSLEDNPFKTVRVFPGLSLQPFHQF